MPTNKWRKLAENKPVFVGLVWSIRKDEWKSKWCSACLLGHPSQMNHLLVKTNFFSPFKEQSNFTNHRMLNASEYAIKKAKERRLLKPILYGKKQPRQEKVLFFVWYMQPAFWVCFSFILNCFCQKSFNSFTYYQKCNTRGEEPT